MTEKNIRKSCVFVLAAYIILAFIFFWIAGEQLYFRYEETAPVIAREPVGELTHDTEIRQPFVVQADAIIEIYMPLSTYDRENTSHFRVSIVDKTGTTVTQTEVFAGEIANNVAYTVHFDQPVQVIPGERYDLVITSPDGIPGNAITAWQGNTMATARAEVAINITEPLLVNGEARDGMLCYSLSTRSTLWFGVFYWYIVLAVGILLAIYSIYLCVIMRKGKNSLALRLISAFQRYGYLMRQLVARDFKTKYKRSVLGVLWSFLNPLLTMMVQYIVFSTLFKSEIPNFPLYLLSGIVCFNFFSEGSSMALQSIVGNASLITKVYVPKYVYPLSRVFSSAVNLLLSLIPLLGVILLTGTPIRPAVLLLPFGLICLMGFCLGMGFILSTMMVFFRDTQFLWSVVSMLWMYATPIFYPESIIPEQYMFFYKCNPLYHIIRFVRIVLMDGISPEPKAYVFCLAASFIPLVIGAVIFKCNQDKFILNL